MPRTEKQPAEEVRANRAKLKNKRGGGGTAKFEHAASMTDCVYLSSSLGISAQAPEARGRGRDRQGHASRDGHWSWPMLPRAPWHFLTAPPAKRARPSWHPRFEGLVLDYETKVALDGHVDTVDTTKEAVSCSICLHPAFGGVITSCQHLFHNKCFQNSLPTTRRRCCPN